MKNDCSLLLRFVTVLIFAFWAQNSTAQMAEEVLEEGMFAPSFQVRDINGLTHSIEKYKGKKILLSFYRNAGCPVCNYRFHELEDERLFFEKKNVVLLAIYESSVPNLKLMIDTNQYLQHIISDEEGLLYDLYAVEASRTKITKGLVHGAMSKAQKGKKFYAHKIKQDGNPNRIAADFLIDENGNISIAYYGKYLGDRLPLTFLKSNL